ncbi:unnamed protein product [Eretmochelys imbricata]
MAGSGGRLPLALLAPVAAGARALARGLVFLCSERCAWLLGAPCLRRAYHAWLAGAVLLGPLLHPFANPHAILANQRNFFSRTFVASAWGWTCILAGGFALLGCSCLLLAEELAVFRRYLARGHPAGTPLRLVFLLNVLLLALWNLLLLGTAVYGPAYGPQLVGAARGHPGLVPHLPGLVPGPLVAGPPGGPASS